MQPYRTALRAVMNEPSQHPKKNIILDANNLSYNKGHRFMCIKIIKFFIKIDGSNIFILYLIMAVLIKSF